MHAYNRVWFMALLALLASMLGIAANSAAKPEAWALPEQALFFVQDPAVSWEAAPRETRE